MAVMEICCQNAVAALVEYDYELHAFTKVLDVVDMGHVPIAARAVDGAYHEGPPYVMVARQGHSRHEGWIRPAQGRPVRHGQDEVAG